MRDVAAGVEHIHSLGLAHNNVYPDNVLVFRQAEGPVVGKLSDLASVTGELASSVVCFGAAVAVRLCVVAFGAICSVIQRLRCVVGPGMTNVCATM